MSKKSTAHEQRFSKFEQFVIDNQRILSYVAGAILLVVAGYFGWKRFIVEPKEKEAETLIYPAQIYFENDSLEKALYGDSVNYGFIDIADEYGITKTGNLASYYSGIILLKLGKYEEAIDYLKDFKSDSKIIQPMAYGAIGDAYVQLQDYDKAADYYQKAVDSDPNKFTAPLYLKKAGLVLEEMGDYDEAKEMYQKIKDDYPDTQEATDIEKYIGRVEAKLFTKNNS